MKMLKSLLPDALLLAGTAAVSYGAWLVHQPSGFIVGGALLLLAGFLTAKAA